MSEYQIRLARPDDISQIMQMGHEFYQQTQEAKWGFPFRFADVESLVRKLIERENGFLLVGTTPKVKGMLACAEYETWFHYAKQLIELWWWVDPEWRRTGIAHSLVAKAEDIARKAGYDTIIMANLDYVSTAPIDMYLKNGYKPYERHFAKLL